MEDLGTGDEDGKTDEKRDYLRHWKGYVVFANVQGQEDLDADRVNDGALDEEVA